MSIAKQVVCDGCGTARECGDLSGTTMRQVLHREDGWTVGLYGGGDYCEACWGARAIAKAAERELTVRAERALRA